MPAVELSAGPVDYVDTGGDGPVVVFTHGLPMNETQWRKVVPLLPGYRCVLPTLPMGAHRHPMHRDADLSERGQALILGELLERLDLHDVTLVMNDWGGPQFLVTEGRAERVGRLVLVACEAFDNFPPPQARPMAQIVKVPGGAWLLMQLLRTKLFRHHKKAYGIIAKHGVPDDVLDDWFAPPPTTGTSAATSRSSPPPPRPARCSCAGPPASPTSTAPCSSSGPRRTA